MELLDVDVRLGVEADLDAVLALEPDVVACATGSVPRVPGTPGIDCRPRRAGLGRARRHAPRCGGRVAVVSQEDHFETPNVADFLATAGSRGGDLPQVDRRSAPRSTATRSGRSCGRIARPTTCRSTPAWRLGEVDGRDLTVHLGVHRRAPHLRRIRHRGAGLRFGARRPRSTTSSGGRDRARLLPGRLGLGAPPAGRGHPARRPCRHGDVMSRMSETDRLPDDRRDEPPPRGAQPTWPGTRSSSGSSRSCWRRPSRRWASREPPKPRRRREPTTKKKRSGGGMLIGPRSPPRSASADMDALGYTHISVCATKMWSYYYHRDFIMDYPIEAVGEAVAESDGRIIGTASYDPFRITDSLAEVEHAVRSSASATCGSTHSRTACPPTTAASTRCTRSAWSSASPSASRSASPPRCCRPTAAGPCWPTTSPSSSPTCASTCRTPAGRGSTSGARCCGAIPTCTATSPPTTPTASTSAWCASWTPPEVATRCSSAPTVSASSAARRSSSSSTSPRRPSAPCCTTTPCASSAWTTD